MPKIRSKQILGDDPINSKDLTTKEYVDNLVNTGYTEGTELSPSEQRKLAYFHALSKSMIKDTQLVHESPYKSAHNVKISEVWTDDINFAIDYSSAVLESNTNYAVTLVEKGILNEISGSSGQTYNFLSGSTFIRPWISPVDISDPITNNPSLGYSLLLYDQFDTLIPNGAWTIDYYAGIIHFSKGYTPNDMGWGAIKATFFYYSGNFGSSTTLSVNNTNMSVLDTSNISKLACSTPIIDKNLNNSIILVFINGVQVNVGDLNTDDCYFSNDGGITKRSSGSEKSGDYLYWNYNVLLNPVSGYELNSLTDKISFIHLTP